MLNFTNSFFRHFKKWILERRREIPSSLDFPDPNIEDLKIILDLSERGKTNGEQNIPSTISTIFDDVELEIISKIESLVKKNHNNFLNHLRSYIYRVGSPEIAATRQKIKKIGGIAKANLDAKISYGKDFLTAAKRDVKESYLEFAAFKQKNKINRAARYPDSKLLQWAIITFIFILESALNGKFFARGLDLGLSEGVLNAALISACNIMVGLIFGWFLIKYVNHKNIILKLFGIAAGGLYIGLVVIFNFLIAHYRMALIKSPENANEQAIITFFQNPFIISEFESIILIIIGIVFSIIACADGYFMDDSYPRYGSLDRHLKKKEDEYIAGVQDLREELESIHNDALAELDPLLTTLGSVRNEINSVNANVSIIKGKFIKQLDLLGKGCNELLVFYRNINKKHRTEPAPEHFSFKWILNEDSMNIEKNIQEIEKQLSETAIKALATLDEAFNLHSSTCENINREFQTSINEFKKLEDLSQLKQNG